MNLRALIVFAKDPVQGKVKTRLARSLGDDFAIRFYKKCIRNVLSELQKLDSGINVYLFSDKRGLQINKQERMDIIFHKQSGNDLGERMKNSFTEVLNGSSSKAILIGTDVPDISCKIIEDAFNSLDESDVVLGPAKDGGYYLIGMKEQSDFLFKGIDWGSEKVLNQTILKLNEAEKRVKILEKLHDIDTEADLEAWLENDIDSDFKHLIKLEYKNL